MENLTELPRKTLRYRRSDIKISCRKKMQASNKLELLNISQQGMLIKLASNLKLHKPMKFIIKFDEKIKFVLNGNIVRKERIQNKNVGELKATKKTLISTDNSVYQYGVYFNEVDDDFKSYLLRSNIAIRLRYRSLLA